MWDARRLAKARADATLDVVVVETRDRPKTVVGQTPAAGEPLPADKVVRVEIAQPSWIRFLPGVFQDTDEEHADGHSGAHCGQRIGGQLYERFKSELRRRGLDDVLLSPNACIAQHAAGCMVMVYPDGIWYAVDSLDAVNRIIDEHLVGGRPVDELVHRRLGTPASAGVRCLMADPGPGQR